MKKLSSALIALSMPALLWGSHTLEKDDSILPGQFEGADPILREEASPASTRVGSVESVMQSPPQSPVPDWNPSIEYWKLAAEHQEVLKELRMREQFLSGYSESLDLTTEALNQARSLLKAEQDAHIATKAQSEAMALYMRDLQALNHWYFSEMQAYIQRSARAETLFTLSQQEGHAKDHEIALLKARNSALEEEVRATQTKSPGEFPSYFS